MAGAIIGGVNYGNNEMTFVSRHEEECYASMAMSTVKTTATVSPRIETDRDSNREEKVRRICGNDHGGD